VTPLEVGGAFDGAGVEVAVGGAYADAADAAFPFGLGHNAVEGLCQFGDIRFYYIVGIRTDNGLGQNGATGVYNAAFGGLSTNVNANN